MRNANGTFAKGSTGKSSPASTHGYAGKLARGKEYRAWKRMNSRCHSTLDPKFDSYGGRGIRVCDQWRHDFPRFLSDVGPAPSPVDQEEVAKLPCLSGLDISILAGMQIAHDEAARYRYDIGGDVGVFRDAFRKRMIGVANGHNLTIPEVAK